MPRAIEAGERDRPMLAALKIARTWASTDEIAQSLKGSWLAERRLPLRQALAMFDFNGTQLAKCDVAMETQLQTLAAHTGDPQPCKKRDRAIPANATQSWRLARPSTPKPSSATQYARLAIHATGRTSAR